MNTRIQIALSLLATVALSGCPTKIGGTYFFRDLAGGEGDGGEVIDEDGGNGEADLMAPAANPNANGNDVRDTDCDGLSDEEEFSLVYADGMKTDPDKADTDGDGLSDGQEIGRTSSVDPMCAFIADSDTMTRTFPTQADSDLDGIPDGAEDRDHNGRRDPGETDPNNPECDGDGLLDGVEDANHNGQIDPGETNPLSGDTDTDRISDGVEVKIVKTDPLRADTDGDGCFDGDEDWNQNGIVDQGETDPKKADCGVKNQKDSDGDGIPDGIEDANGNGKFDVGETDFNNNDTDGDGLGDGVEDKNKDGKVGLGETDPRRIDTDCDGLIDGPDQMKLLGEDANSNAIVDKGETDPTKSDTDGDGLLDGVERGVVTNPDPNNCKGFMPDADPTTKTDPTNADTDADGVADGAEDANQNGKVDPGELDPLNPNDATGPIIKVCSKQNLRNVVFQQESQSDIQLALPDTFKEVTTMKVNGVQRGLIGWDATNKTAFVVWRQTAPNNGPDPTSDETAIRPLLNNTGALSNPTTQTFTTWDGYAALQAFYDQNGGADVKAQANAIANALVGNGAGALMGAGGAAGPFKLQVEYVHRSAQSVVVLVALTTAANFTEPAIFTVRDTAGGSALAQFGDPNGVQCEPFVPKGGKVDFLFVVDDSGSMQAYQAALANTGTATGTALNNSSLDWRIAMITTSYVSGGYGNTGVIRGFTRSIPTFQTWLNQGNGAWVGISGDGIERCLEAGSSAISAMTPSTQQEMANKFRADAAIVVIILGDADDQSAYSSAQFLNFYTKANGTVGGYTNKSPGPITVHGIICPNGNGCGETQQNPQRHAAVITGTGGIRGDINTPNSITATMNQIVSNSIAAAGYRMQKPPIGASIKVSMDAVTNAGACNPDDIPRSRVNGFDFDGVNRTISFFGACRPVQGTKAAAVSYRYWIDSTPNPNGTPPPCAKDMFFDPQDPDWCKGRLVCNRGTDVCECPPNCGAPPPPGKYCNQNRLVCDFICLPDCGGKCVGYQQCDANLCACACPQNASCAPGYKFDAMKCACTCDVGSLKCGATYDADSTSCRCVCKPACGGCPQGMTCNASKCECVNGVG